MFRKELDRRLQEIFGLRVTFDASSDVEEAFEQDKLFVEIIQATNRASSNKIYSKVTGQLVMYSEVNKLPYGYFTKRIENADPELTKDFFFSPEESPVTQARMQNITERRIGFVFLFSEQFDPNKGELTTLETEG